MTSAERFEIAWRGVQKTIAFRELAKRIGPHTVSRNTPGEYPTWVEFAFPDGSSLISYGRGVNHRFKVFANRRARNG